MQKRGGGYRIQQPRIAIVEPKKAASSRESHGDQELSRVNKDTAFFRHKKVELRGR